MEETTKVTKGCAVEEAREKAEAKAYLVEKFYSKKRGYIALYIIGSILLASALSMIWIWPIPYQQGAIVSAIIGTVLSLVVSIIMFFKATKIRKRRILACSRMREYERKHPEVAMPHVVATIEQKETPSSADELLKWKKLLDEGAITQEEYDAKKKQLLGL